MHCLISLWYLQDVVADMLDMNENKAKPDNSPQGKFLLWFSDLRASLRVAWNTHVRGGQGLGRRYNAQEMDGIDDYHVEDGNGGGNGKCDGNDQEVSLSSVNDGHGVCNGVGNGSSINGSNGMRRSRVEHRDDDIKPSPHKNNLQSIHIHDKLFQSSVPNRDEEDGRGGGSGSGSSNSLSGIHSPPPKGIY